MPTPIPAVLAAAAERGLGKPEDTIEIAPHAPIQNLLVGVIALVVGLFLSTRAIDKPNVLLIIIVVVAMLVGVGSIWGWWMLRSRGVEQLTSFPGGLVHGFANKQSVDVMPWPQVKAQFQQREQKRDTMTQTLNDLKLFNDNEQVLHRIAPADTDEGHALVRLYERIIREQARGPQNHE